ncbi:hypothetical protein GUJ93_ZPchr0014g47551 [Zizania palustris]|uniref:SNARE-complex protein Syntaxin-18 N-terminal domain-containing protein n=1 Tax=Zizania palustris TaxID=103762 RepID=A0A8J5T8E9_ZIZPA|nr:hypothetical protein GUJ93_ZPchr0014g47551 [Zizania palustris]
MGGFDLQVKERAKELKHIKTAVIRGVKVVGNSCKKTWNKVRRVPPAPESVRADLTGRRGRPHLHGLGVGDVEGSRQDRGLQGVRPRRRARPWIHGVPVSGAHVFFHHPEAVAQLPFTNTAIKTLESIRELERFIVKHRKDYVDLHRTTEQERDNIEHEVGVFVKACKEQIDILKNRIHAEKSGSSKSWLGTRDESSLLDLIAHQHGVVLILSERLHSEVSTAPLRVQEQLLDDETRALQVELTNLLDAVQETETKMIEMSALNHLMSTHVLQQAQQIQYLYDQAVEATNNVERGNKELSQAIERNSSSRTFLLLFFFVLTFSVLFLDWYSN